MLKLVILLILTSCGSYSKPKNVLDVNKVYRHDLCVAVDGVEQFCGAGVLPFKKEYDFTFKSRSVIKYATISSCHSDRFGYNELTWSKKNNRILNFIHTNSLEALSKCPLTISTYNIEHTYDRAQVIFENKDDTLQAKLYCNGEVSETTGTSICQSRKGLLQSIVFQEPVAFGRPVSGLDPTNDSLCPKMKIADGNKSVRLYLMPLDQCTYTIIGLESGKTHRLHTLGYEDFVIRE